MIARIWRGSTRASDADQYVEYLRETGIHDYRSTPGNRGAYILRRRSADTTEFITLSFWDSMESIVTFARDDSDQAVFYTEDDRFLLERDATVAHYEVFE